MVFKGLIATATAVALSVAPTVAAAQTAPVEMAPATESVEGSELRGRGFIIPLLAIIAIILGILAAIGDDDDDLRTSP